MQGLAHGMVPSDVEQSHVCPHLARVLGSLDDALHSHVAHSALGHVYDALEGAGVVRVGGETEVGHGITDLRLVLEASTA